MLFLGLLASEQVCQPICAGILEVQKIFESVFGNIAVLSLSSEWSLWSIAFSVGIASFGFVISWCHVLPKKDCDHKIYVTIRCDNTVRTLRVSPQQQLGDFKQAAAKLHGIPDGDGTIIVRVRGKTLRDDWMTLEAAGISNHCVVRLDLELRGGAGPDFSSIPAKKYRDLLAAIEVDFKIWRASCKETPRYKWGRLKGQVVEWDGMSDCVKFFFEAVCEAEKIDPREKYRQFYDSGRHTVATSYVWAATGLFQMAGERFGLSSSCLD